MELPTISTNTDTHALESSNNGVLNTPKPHIFTPEEPIKRPVITVIGSVFMYILLLCTILYSGYLLYLRYNYNSQLSYAQDKESKLEEEISILRAGGNSGDALKASIILDTEMNKRIIWSQIVADIMSTESSGMQYITFLVDEKRRITASGEAMSEEDIALLLERLEASNPLRKPFLKNMTEKKNKSTTSETGEVIESTKTYTFQISFSSPSNSVPNDNK